MSDLEKKIEAVEFLLASFFKYSNDASERENAIREKYAENDSVAIYAEFPKEKLQDQLILLQNRLNGMRIFNYDYNLLLHIDNYVH